MNSKLHRSESPYLKVFRITASAFILTGWHKLRMRRDLMNQLHFSLSTGYCDEIPIFTVSRKKFVTPLFVTRFLVDFFPAEMLLLQRLQRLQVVTSLTIRSTRGHYLEELITEIPNIDPYLLCTLN